MPTLRFPIPVKAEGRFIKQSGPIGRFGHVVLVVEQVASPKIEFSWQVPESSIPAMFHAAVARGVCRLFEPDGKLAEFTPGNLLVRVVGGTFHPTDSNEISCEIASANAFVNAVAANAAA